MESKTIKGLSRRSVIEENIAAERILYLCVSMIEELGADEKLTEAQIKILEAKEILSDWVDDNYTKMDS